MIDASFLNVVISLVLMLSACGDMTHQKTNNLEETVIQPLEEQDNVRSSDRDTMPEIELPFYYSCGFHDSELRNQNNQQLPLPVVELEKLLDTVILNSQLIGKCVFLNKQLEDYEIFLLYNIGDINVPYVIVSQGGKYLKRIWLLDNEFYCGTDEDYSGGQRVTLEQDGSVILIKSMKTISDGNEVGDKSDTLTFNLMKFLNR